MHVDLCIAVIPLEMRDETCCSGSGGEWIVFAITGSGRIGTGTSLQQDVCFVVILRQGYVS